MMRPATGRNGSALALGFTSAAMLGLMGADLAIPNVTLGAFAAVIVVAAWLYLGRAAGLVMVALAVAGRAVDAELDDIPAATAAIESAAYVAFAALLAFALRERAETPVLTRERAPHGAPAAETSFAVPAVALPSSSPLTPREREVVAMASRGMSSTRIAERLAISRRTVESHLSHAYDKLEVHSKQDLIAQSLAASPVPADSDE